MKQFDKIRKPNTNVLSVRLDTLVKNKNNHVGDPAICEICSAVLSNSSKVNNDTWDCEFCGNANRIDVDLNEIPKESDVTYLLEPPVDFKSAEGPTLVYCIDISGSMNISVDNCDTNTQNDKYISRLFVSYLT